MKIKSNRLLPALAALLFAGVATAGVPTYTDNFQGNSSTLQWTALGDACLTAGNGSGSIPSCASKGFLTDIAGQGALLLTPAQHSQAGAILLAPTASQPAFPMSQGLQVTFTTYTFGGSADGPAKNGADGLTFFMTDGTASAPTKTGGTGGAMGYDCSNTNTQAEGMANAYIGLGVDEWGNFLNSGDNGRNGALNTNATTGTGIAAIGSNPFQNYVNSAPGDGSGYQYQPERIGMRGAGNLTWKWLQTQNSAYYSGTAVNSGKVQTVCRTGKYVSSGTNSGANLQTIPFNYDPIPGSVVVLPQSQPIANNSSTATRNPATGTPACVGNSPACNTAWPITYKVTLSPSGLLNFSYSYNNGAMTPVLTNQSITLSNGAVPAKMLFGFSAGTGGSDNVHEITCFQAAPLQSNSSAAANTVSGQYRTGTQVYLASYSSNNWWGSLQALSVNVSGSALVVATNATWDANCVLTGGPCSTMAALPTGSAPVVPVQGPAARTLLTSNGNNGNGGGIPLEWANLTSAQQTALNTNSAGATDNNGAIRLDWLRGGRSNEQLQSPPGNLRARDFVLGDIIDSSPTFVGAPNPGAYPNAFNDGLYGGASTAPENQSGAQSYGAFSSTNATRLNVVYVGGNDGLLHGFEAGAFDSSGNYVATNNDGKEVLGYMPAGVLANKSVKLATPGYVHDYMVDATPGVGDLFYNKQWHTWLVGGVGSSGQEIYALDITNPTGFSEGVTSASSTVIGDWSGTSPGLSHLGNTVGTPIIARMHNGQWAIIFGNGVGSTQSAGVYVGLVDPSTGAVTYQFLDTGVGSSTSPDGIAYVTSVDLDGDHIADYLYAGDTQGNVWRFDVTSNNAGSWAVSKFGTSVPTPLFVAMNAANQAQPITTAITVAAVQTPDGSTRDMLYFGTGQKTLQTATHGDQFAAGTQTFYGIWDWDMSNWNSLSSTKYASLTGPQSIARSGLLAQTLVAQTAVTSPAAGTPQGYRTLPTGTTVCWQGSTACTSGNNQYGWLFDLPDPSEQVIYNPTISGGAVLVSTVIPPVASATQCTAAAPSGWTMAFDPATGGGLPQSYFPNAGGSFSANSDGSTIGGVKLGAVGTPTMMSYNGQVYMITQTVVPGAAITPVNPQGSSNPARASWREIRN